MVHKSICACCGRSEQLIASLKEFYEVKKFFDSQCEMGDYQEIAPAKPYYSWKSGCNEKKWYATKWYCCQECGCLWEVNYPDFPTKGFVRKFPDGKYTERGY